MNQKPTAVVGIPRETVNLWERRVVLTPSHVETLVHRGIRVIVQPSNRRVFTCDEYLAAGAEINEDLSAATVILGVKRPVGLTTDDLLPNKTYAFFTHTIKAQKENMELLDTILERNIRILDYECMVNENNFRVLAFGKFAGYSGMIDILHGLGQRLLALGHTTPFMNVAMPHNYSSMELARQAVQMAGYGIAMNQMPRSIGPLIFVFTGLGNVSQGARAIFRLLPHKFIQPAEMKETAMHGRTDIVYGVVISEKDHLRHKETGNFDMADFLAHPQNYRTIFPEEYAPYMSVLVNGVFWRPNDPRLLTVEDCKRLLVTGKPCHQYVASTGAPVLPQRLIAVCDISADPNGSLEFMQTCTTIEKPFVVYNPETDTETEGISGDGFLVCSIDNMPTQLPVESSTFFGDGLMPYIDDMLLSDANTPFEEFKAGPVIKNCTIASNGKLTPRFEYIAELRKQKEAASGIKHRVLILGAGYVVPPIVGYLTRDPQIQVTVVSNLVSDLENIKKAYPDVPVKQLDILQDTEGLGRLVAEHDLVMSMVPWKFHPQVFAVCIKHKRNVLTASYCSPALREMEQQIKDAGMTAFMEIGLDPGIDHLLAMECFDETYAKGGKVVSYESYTGGVPAPEYADNPLRYKFSWSPEAAMTTVLNGAIYLENGEVKQIPAGGALMDHAHPMNDLVGFNLEGYPNRDSTSYKDIYKLKNCHTVIRGTLRYKGFTKVIKALIELGFMDQKPHPKLSPSGPSMTWKEVTCVVLGLDPKSSVGTVEAAIRKKLNMPEETVHEVLALGLLSDKVAKLCGSPFSTLSLHFSDILAYGPNERDLIVMSHQIGVEWPDKRRELKIVRLVIYGEEGKGKAGLAMSRTVGLPAAIAARMVLNGEVKQKGFVLPFAPEIYKPILECLKREGIKATETIITL
nr:unnamed protein product [Spirometra erinaceieuropaei]